MDVTIEPAVRALPRPHEAAEPSAPTRTADPASAPAPAELTDAVAVDADEMERELRLIDAAISMVRRGVANRVTLASLPLGSAVLYAAQARGALYGLHVRPALDDDAAPPAIIVESTGA